MRNKEEKGEKGGESGHRECFLGIGKSETSIKIRWKYTEGKAS